MGLVSNNAWFELFVNRNFLNDFVWHRHNNAFLLCFLKGADPKLAKRGKYDIKLINQALIAIDNWAKS